MGPRMALSVITRGPCERLFAKRLLSGCPGPTNAAQFHQQISWQKRAGMASFGCVATYIWPGQDSGDIRILRRVLQSVPSTAAEVPVACFDGNQTGQASIQFSSVILKPVGLYRNPYGAEKDVLVLCQTMAPPSLGDKGSNISPHPTNNRAPCERVMAEASASQPTFMVVQEYSLWDGLTNRPLGCHVGSAPGRSYCAVGFKHVAGRRFADRHLDLCLAAGLQMGGNYQIGCPGQYAYLLGPCQGINLGDQLLVSRYLLQRLSEDANVVVDLDPNPLPGTWGCTGAALRYHTRETLGPNGWLEIERHMTLLKSMHGTTLMFYGSNGKRMANGQGASWLDKFTCGIEDRSASVRIPAGVRVSGGGYYEDRRPASNMDPYLATMALVCATLGVEWPVSMAMDINSEDLSDSFDFDDDEDDDDDEGSFSSSWMDHRESAHSSMHPPNRGTMHDDCQEASSTGPSK